MDNNDNENHERIQAVEDEIDAAIEARADWGSYRRMVLAELKSIRKTIEIFDRQYVRRSEFLPVKNVVYGMVAAVLFAVLIALLTMVVTRKI